MSAPFVVYALVIAFAVISFFALYRMGKLRRLTFKADIAKAISLSFQVNGEDEPKQLPSSADSDE